MQKIFLVVVAVLALSSSISASSLCPAHVPVALGTDTADCSIYYICLNGIAIESRQCEDGTNFSVEFGACVDSEMANCKQKQEVCSSNPELHLEPHPTNCSLYYICQFGVIVSERECALIDDQKTHFSAMEEKCMLPYLAKCAPEWNICPDTSLSIQPHPENCSKYFLCDQGEAIEQDCPEGLHYNQATKTCTDPESAKCEGLSTMTPTQTTETTVLPTSTQPPEETTTSIPSTTEIPTEATTPAATTSEGTTLEDTTQQGSTTEAPSIDCNPGDDILLPFPGDCTKYYFCDNGNLIEAKCPGDLHFNPELQICDFPENAGCEELQEY